MMPAGDAVRGLAVALAIALAAPAVDRKSVV